MLGPIADINKRPVVFLDSLGARPTEAASQLIADLHRAFDVLYVLTSNVFSGRSHDEVVFALEQIGLNVVAQNMHTEWSTPFDHDSDLAEQIEAWHAISTDRTPTSYVVIAAAARGSSLQAGGLAEYAVLFEDVLTQSDYLKSCQILHSQLTFEPFNSDWY